LAAVCKGGCCSSGLVVQADAIPQKTAFAGVNNIRHLPLSDFP